MVKYRISEQLAFQVIGRKTWISGPDNSLFGQFWDVCRQEGLFTIFDEMNSGNLGSITKSSVLGISRVEKDPEKREFYYMIAIEHAGKFTKKHLSANFETFQVPASKWAIFECKGKVPDAIVQAEMYAFMEWLPQSGYAHAMAPEMEVYFPNSDGQSDDCYTEFWLPIIEQVQR